MNLFTSMNDKIAKTISYTYIRLNIVYFLISNTAISIVLCNKKKKQNRKIYILYLEM